MDNANVCKNKPINANGGCSELDNMMKNKFRHLSNNQLIDRINSKFRQDKNDDDEVYEMIRRRNAGKLKFRVNFDTYELIG